MNFEKISTACTLWGCAGKMVKNGGILISKNRDWNENSYNSVEKFAPEEGFKYFSLVAVGDESGVKGGINEKGVAVFTAT